jgi:nucleoside-diphosphate-sugar epimerase
MGPMSISALLVFCADSQTGYRLVQLGKQAGKDVIAVIRRRADPAALNDLDARIVVADPLDRTEVAGVFADVDPEIRPEGLAVVCLLGGDTKLNSQGNINVIDAARGAGVRRFLIVTSIGCGDSADAVDDFVKLIIGKALRAKNWAETHLRSTDMDWTIIRPGGPARDDGDGEPILVESPSVTGHISPWDLGDAIFQALESPGTIRRALTAVNTGDAFDIKGKPLVAADL